MSRKTRHPEQNSLLLMHNMQLTPYPDNIPKSNYYRSELTPLLGKTVTICGTLSQIRKNKIAYNTVNHILIEEATLFEKLNPYPLNHIWTSVEKGLIYANQLNIKNSVICTGFLYEYISKGYRNIGFKLQTIKKLPTEEEI